MATPTAPIASSISSAQAAPSVSLSEAGEMDKVTTKLRSVSIDTKAVAHPARGTTVKLSVPLDATFTARPSALTSANRKMVRRDSLERREAFLKGKEGSRQRRRWENDRLLNNPWAEPPLPSDWEVRPTYPTRTIPYYLAPLWDAAEFQRAIESKLTGRRNSVRHRKRATNAAAAYGAGMSPMEEAATSIPKEVRARLKHARSAKGLLQDLEEDVRDFVRRWNAKEARLRADGLHDAPITSDSENEDEEIVFVGRNGAMHDSSSHKTSEDGEGLVSKEKLVFEGTEGDKGAAFGRWLVHCVGSYYGLKTWSVTTDSADGEQRMRQAYVGVDSRVRGWMGRGSEVGQDVELPRPLWGMV